MHQVRHIKGGSVVVEQQFSGGEQFGKSEKYIFFFNGFLAEPLPVNPGSIFIKYRPEKIKMRVFQDNPVVSISKNRQFSGENSSCVNI